MWSNKPHFLTHHSLLIYYRWCSREERTKAWSRNWYRNNKSYFFALRLRNREHTNYLLQLHLWLRNRQRKILQGTPIIWKSMKLHIRMLHWLSFFEQNTSGTDSVLRFCDSTHFAYRAYFPQTTWSHCYRLCWRNRLESIHKVHTFRYREQNSGNRSYWLLHNW